jgi:hypothetical protein
MIKYFVKAFKITNENIILTTPLVLFLLLSSIYFEVAQNAPRTLPSATLLLTTVLFMFSAFFSGWFFMVKKAIDLDKKEFIIDEDKSKASFSLIKELPVGIGEYFFSFIGGLILYSGLFLILAYFGYQIGLHFIGKPNIHIEELKMLLNATIMTKSTLNAKQLTNLLWWSSLFFIVTMIYSYITMFWAAQIVSGTKNPLIAFFKSLSFTFKNFLSTIILFIYIHVLSYFVSLLINLLAMIPPTIYVVSLVMYLIAMIIYFYFVVYTVVLVFLYYDGENNNCEKTEAQCSDNCQNNCNCGSDSVGQEQSGDSDSKED